MATIRDLLLSIPCGFGDRIIGELTIGGILQNEATDVNGAINAVIGFEPHTETRQWLEGVRDYLQGQQCSDEHNRRAGYCAAQDALSVYVSALRGGKTESTLSMLLKKN